MPKLRSVRVRTKNFTAEPLKRAIFVPFNAVCRLGSTTPTSTITTRPIVECNTVEAVNNSRSKLRMKECFQRANIPQSRWYHGRLDVNTIKNHFGITVNEGYQLVGKAIFGFQGRGMVLISNDTELADFCRHHTPENFYLEIFHNYGREYRIHATQNEVFMVWRKLRREDASERWFFNSHNCNWVGETHPLFDKPSNWETLCSASVNAIRAVGLDIGAVDIRVSSSNPDSYIVLEVNSAPALGVQGVEKYKEQIKEILVRKYEK
jgi:glutathione synthase/RimK-type ligase-like ATP-grasp enzyme